MFSFSKYLPGYSLQFTVRNLGGESHFLLRRRNATHYITKIYPLLKHTAPVQLIPLELLLLLLRLGDIDVDLNLGDD